MPEASPAFLDLPRKRRISHLLRTGLLARQWKAAVEAIRSCDEPTFFLGRYLTARGAYPTSIQLRTPIGPIALTAYSWHDIRTIHEIFLALDYQIDSSAKVIVDFGANIGVSAAYFLTRNRENFAYLYEPAPKNVDRLRQNLRNFSSRFQLEEVAVGSFNGKVRFGIEETGRYGGIEVQTNNYIEVPCRDANEILRTIVDKHNKIDVLKVDVEGMGMEEVIITRLSPDLAAKIELLLVEFRFFETNPLIGTHSMTKNWTVVRFEREK